MACTIRTLRESDIPALARHANNPKVAAMLRNSFPSPYTEDDARFFICELAPSLAHGEGLVPTVFGIEVDGECAGVVSLDVGSDIHARSAELGIWVGEAHWRKGVAQEAVRQALSWAFDDDPDTGLGLLRVYAEAYAFNEPSQRLLRKVGFQQEAVLRCHHRKGELGDVVLFSITKPGGPVGGELIDARSASSADADAAAAAAAAGGAEDASGAGAGADCDTSPPSRPELTAKREAASLPSALWAARADLADDFRVTGARVSLRRYRADDADNVALYANNDKIARWLRDLFPHPYTIEEAREWAGEIAPAWKREADGAPFVFAVADVSDDSLIGSISLTPGVDVHAGSAELGYCGLRRAKLLRAHT